MTTISLLLLLAGCTGSPADTDTSNVGDADTDADSDADSDADADVTFDIVLPMAATVMVDEIVVPCDSDLVCTVNAEGDGTFEVTVTHDTYYFIPKQVVIEGGVPDVDTVTYATGGCASDANYDGTSWCDDWVMSEYQVTVQGECCEQDGDDCYEVTTGHADLNGDGVEEAVLDMDWSIQFNASGNPMYGFSDGVVDGYGSVSSDLSTIMFWFDAGDPDLHQKIFTCVSD